MRKQVVTVVVVVSLAVGIGIGAGVLITKPKLDESKQTIEGLTLAMEQSKAESDEIIQKNSAQVTQLKSELTRANSTITQARAELTRLNGELAQARAELQRLGRPQPGEASPEPVRTPAAPAASPTTPAGTPAAAPAANTQSVDYVIKEGDSFWKIADEQLGNGIRWEEILPLNPTLNKDSVLVVGAKIKIPSK